MKRIVLFVLTNLAVMLVLGVVSLLGFDQAQYIDKLVRSRCDAAELLRRLKERAPSPLRELAEKLVDAWPLNLPGVHRLDFAQGGLTLTLGVGERVQVLARLRAKVDLFYLDQACHEAPSEQARQLSAALLPPDLWAQEAQAPASRQALVVGAGFAGMAVAQGAG